MAANPIYSATEREAFEATMRDDDYNDFRFYEPGNVYLNLFTQAGWLAWQRRVAYGVPVARQQTQAAAATDGAIDLTAGPEAAMLALWGSGIQQALATLSDAYQGEERERFWQSLLSLCAGTIGASLASHERARELIATCIEISRKAEIANLTANVH